MFKEEKIVDGILCYRNEPDGEWRAYSPFEMSRRIEALRKQLDVAIQTLEDIHGGVGPDVNDEMALAREALTTIRGMSSV